MDRQAGRRGVYIFGQKYRGADKTASTAPPLVRHRSLRSGEVGGRVQICCTIAIPNRLVSNLEPFIQMAAAVWVLWFTCFPFSHNLLLRFFFRLSPAGVVGDKLNFTFPVKPGPSPHSVLPLLLSTFHFIYTPGSYSCGLDQEEEEEEWHRNGTTTNFHINKHLKQVQVAAEEEDPPLEKCRLRNPWL